MYTANAVAFLSLYALTARAQFNACQGGNCHQIQAAVFAPCGVDPNDGSTFAYAFGICPCVNSETYTLGVTYTGVDGMLTSETGTATGGASSVASVVTIDYTNPNTQIEPGSIVTLNFQDNIGEVYPPETYTNSLVSSIFFTVATSTITSTTETLTVTTSTTTVTTTSTIAQSTSTTPCTTGTLTSTASPSTTTLTSTVTPKPKTVDLIEIIITTTHLSCYPVWGNSRTRNRDRRAEGGLAARQYNTGQYETPYCPLYFGPPVSTTYTTSTAVVTATTTTTDTSVVLDSSTTTDTATPTPATTTICSDVEATVFTTPTDTVNTVTTAARVTTTTTIEFIIVETLFPPHARPCSTHHVAAHAGAAEVPLLAKPTVHHH